MKRLPIPAGQHSVGPLAGEGDWLASGGGTSVVIWHREVARTVEFPVSRSTPDINRHGVLISAGEDGVWRGEEKLGELPGEPSTVRSINADGDVAGASGGALVVWPAGSASPMPLEGTDDGRFWQVSGMDDAGNVVAATSADGVRQGYVWGSEGERVELQPLAGHHEVSPTLIRDGRVYGWSAERGGEWATTSVEWNLRGEVVRTMELGPVFDVNDAGDELLSWSGAVRRADGRVDRWSYPFTMAFPSVLAENGDLYGGQYYEGPAKLFCR
ncbi:hypothetical protein SK854_23920 [Lentzea sp. BCCO 10_0061]|uniref:Uncharacterized protein n=1 Tax=Lentzea sokolovensis TaxID=3095429 RepID=A0ABU4V0D6_9PSEU|nr:hypothetical protein [Lentzea sp. BCCO 10_0061]MDX8145179.1 hypothetical protein [Lentzea sp. BCCO 10_0061]